MTKSNAPVGTLDSSSMGQRRPTTRALPKQWMMAQWTADIAIDSGTAGRLVRDGFPEFVGAAVEAFGLGWDNAAFLVDGRFIFRFPRRRVAAKLIAREIEILPRIAARLPLAISAPCFVGRATVDYPYAFAGYERLAGQTACATNLSDAARASLAVPLAQFLRMLHAVDPTGLEAAGLVGDEIGRLDHRKRAPLIRERLAGLLASGRVPDVERLAAWLDAHAPPPLAAGGERLVHGDLYARHVLLDDLGRPCGIIDWGDVHCGDPAIDLAVAHLMLPQAAHDAFRAEYGHIDERTWSAARYRAVYHALLELDYGIRENDAGMLRIGLAALRLIRPTIG